MIRIVTIREGQRAVVWNCLGRARYVDGPRRLVLVGATVQPLALHSAGPEEYIVITSLDGSTEHRRGPAATWFDPVRHASIRIVPLAKLDANEAIVVYHPFEEKVTRRVERGPALFMPAPDEWLHRFSWHGADPRDPRRKRPSALQFEKLRVIPDQMYYDAENVRTADDALLVVKLMVFFELADIDRMLDQTHDPIGDFINSVTADVVDFAATLNFEAFKEKTEALSQLTTYPQLVRRAETIGYRITKVVYRGYEAGGILQGMHDSAIEARTRLRLEAETERQAQDLADLKQRREGEREESRRAVERQRAQHEAAMQALAHEARLCREQTEREQALALDRRARESELAHQRTLHQEELEFLRGASELRVDLTRYLVARYQNPDKLIRIDGGPASPGAQFHLHETGT